MIENTPDHCPGPTSESAGKSDACAGCPSRNLCSSGAVKDLAAKQAEDVRLITERLTSVKNKILILSGKGGVGKSTFTASVARALAAKNPERNVAILDVDLCGPSQPRILGVSGESIHRSGSGWSPVYVEDNLSVVSIGFLLSSPDDAIVWRGPKKSGMIRQFLTEVDWGDVDYLLIDFPPGTSDEHLSATSLITSADAIIVTTPQEIALLDVRKEIDFCHKTGVNILGVVDNMCEFVCAKCGTQSEIFPQTTGGTEKMCKDIGVPLLGRVPLDPKIARSADEGSDFLLLATTSVAAKALIGIAEKIVNHFEMKLSSAIIMNK